MAVNKFVILFLLLALIVTKICNSQHTEIPYTPATNICKICICLTAKDEYNKTHYVLSCSTKNFRHILANWPEEFGTNHTGQEMIVTFSGNTISLLQQLPQTNAILSFSCRHCEIKEIQPYAFIDTSNILRLDLGWNQLTGDVLHAEIFRGPYSARQYEPIALEDLDLSHNQIHTLDKRIFEHTPNLKKLNLAYNKFDIIDSTTVQAIGSVTELEALDLSSNGLQKLPDSIFKKLSNLKELILQDNKFKTVPENIGLLGSTLQKLNFGGNPIDIIKNNDFIHLDSLTYLNISGMSLLQTIEIGSFSQLSKLEILFCNNNPILTSIDFEGLKNAKNLKQLDISKCSLKTLNMEIDLINIKNSSITSSNNSMKIWSKLRSFKISNNQWHCDCMLIRILEQFTEQIIHYDENKGRCSTPYDLAGSLIYNLSGERICNLPVPRKLRIPIHDPPTFLKPKSLAFSIITVTTIVAFGLAIGFGVVLLRKKLRKDDFGYTVPIRYTTVRNSTMSVE